MHASRLICIVHVTPRSSMSVIRTGWNSVMAVRKSIPPAIVIWRRVARLVCSKGVLLLPRKRAAFERQAFVLSVLSWLYELETRGVICSGQGKANRTELFFDFSSLDVSETGAVTAVSCVWASCSQVQHEAPQQLMLKVRFYFVVKWGAILRVCYPTSRPAG